jgi:hypothetical protein
MKWPTSSSKDTNKQWKASMAISNGDGHRHAMGTIKQSLITSMTHPQGVEI